MTTTINELFTYIKNPKLEKDSNKNLFFRLKKSASIFLITLSTSFFFTILISITQEAGLLATTEHAVDDIFDNQGSTYFFLLAVIIAPILEELIFRGPLTLFKKKHSFTIAYYTFAIAFGLLHITNYQPTINILLFSPLLIAPQLFAGLYFGFIRVRFGLIWSIALHASYNFFLFTLIILSKNVLTQI